MSFKRLLLLLIFPLLTGCEFIYALLEIPDPKKQAEIQEAEGRAVGSACRHAGRSLEDCYQLNPTAKKAAVFSGWREMNDYMLMNEMEVVPSRIPQPGDIMSRPRPAPIAQDLPLETEVIAAPDVSPPLQPQ